jgi:hypothetical protein
LFEGRGSLKIWTADRHQVVDHLQRHLRRWALGIMESLGSDGDTVPTITAQQLRAVVTDPAMLAFFH